MSVLGRAVDLVVQAIRIPDADGAGHPQDLMLSTGGGLPLTRRMLVPRWGYRASTYTSLISYEIGGHDLVVAALPDRDGFRPATAAGGAAWTPFAQLAVGERLPEEPAKDLAFSIRHDAGGFRIGGRWRAARLGAYDAARSVES